MTLPIDVPGEYASRLLEHLGDRDWKKTLAFYDACSEVSGYVDRHDPQARNSTTSPAA